MISGILSRSTAALLALGGAMLLFAPDAVLPRLVPDFPAAGFWLGQLLGTAWLGVAALNWLNRSAILGGIYSRTVVLANVAIWFMGALVVLRAASRATDPAALWLLGAVMALPAFAYGWLLMRGPLEADMQRKR